MKEAEYLIHFQKYLGMLITINPPIKFLVNQTNILQFALFSFLCIENGKVIY